MSLKEDLVRHVQTPPECSEQKSPSWGKATQYGDSAEGLLENVASQLSPGGGDELQARVGAGAGGDTGATNLAKDTMPFIIEK